MIGKVHLIWFSALDWIETQKEMGISCFFYSGRVLFYVCFSNYKFFMKKKAKKKAKKLGRISIPT